MIIVEHINIGHIPTLQVAKKSVKDEPLPTVIYFHGFNGEKESSLTIAYKMADKGLRVMLPDAPLHGERAISSEPIEHGRTFWNIVLQAVEEIATITSYIINQSWTVNDRIGIGGTSMGGMITYGALRKYHTIKAAAVLMGTPYLTDRAKNTMKQVSDEDKKVLQKVAEIDITTNLDSIKGRPLFIWHGEKDEIVPVTDSRMFYKMVTDYYEVEDDIQFIEEKDRIHNISKLSIKKTAEWFHKQL